MTASRARAYALAMRPRDDLHPFSDLPVIVGRQGRVAFDDEGEDGDLAVLYCEDADGTVAVVHLSAVQLDRLLALGTGLLHGRRS